MKSECYRCMFMDCEKLVEAPILSSTQLAENCYTYMFNRCYELTNAPDLPATQLADNCYNSMFFDCRKLTKAPDLPAVTLATGCYNYIFYNCGSLNYLKCLAASGLNEANTKEWLGNVSATGTFVCPSSTDISAAGIPSGLVPCINRVRDTGRTVPLVFMAPKQNNCLKIWKLLFFSLSLQRLRKKS